MSLKKYITEAAQAKSQPVTGDKINFNINGIKNISVTVVEHQNGALLVELDDAALKLLESHGALVENPQNLMPGRDFMIVPDSDYKGYVMGEVDHSDDDVYKSTMGVYKHVGSVQTTIGTQNRELPQYEFIQYVLDPRSGREASSFGGDYKSMYRHTVDGLIAGTIKPHVIPRVAGLPEVATEDSVDPNKPKEGDIVRINYNTEHKGQLGQVVELAPSGDFAYVEFKDGSVESYDCSTLSKVSEEESDSYFNTPDDDGFDEGIDDFKKLAGIQKENFTGWVSHSVTPAYPTPRDDQPKLKNVVVTSPGGKVFTFDTEAEARLLFLDKWNAVKNPESGWGVEITGQQTETSDKMLAKMQGNDLMKARRDTKKEEPPKKVNEISEPVLDRYIAKATRDGASKHLKGIETAHAKLNDKWGWRGPKAKVPAGKSHVVKDEGFDECCEVYVKESNTIKRITIGSPIVNENGWTVKIWSK